MTLILHIVGKSLLAWRFHVAYNVMYVGPMMTPRTRTAAYNKNLNQLLTPKNKMYAGLEDVSVRRTSEALAHYRGVT